MMYLATWQSSDEELSVITKRTRKAAEQVFEQWVDQAIADGPDYHDVVRLFTVDDERPDITTRKEKNWFGSGYLPDDDAAAVDVSGGV